MPTNALAARIRLRTALLAVFSAALLLVELCPTTASSTGGPHGVVSAEHEAATFPVVSTAARGRRSTRIFFTTPDDGHFCSVYSARSGGGRVREVAWHNYVRDRSECVRGFSMSPNRRRIVMEFWADGPNGSGIAVAKAGAHRLKWIAPQNFNQSPAWSPNGQWIAWLGFARCSRSTGPGLCLMRPDGRGKKRLLPLRSAGEPVWVNKNTILVSNGRNRPLRVNLSGSRQRVGPRGAYVYDARGDKLLFTRDTQDDWPWPLWFGSRSLTDAVHEARLSPNGRWVAYVDDSGALWRARIDGTNVTQVPSVTFRNYQINDMDW